MSGALTIPYPLFSEIPRYFVYLVRYSKLCPTLSIPSIPIDLCASSDLPDFDDSAPSSPAGPEALANDNLDDGEGESPRPSNQLPPPDARSARRVLAPVRGAGRHRRTSFTEDHAAERPIGENPPFPTAMTWAPPRTPFPAIESARRMPYAVRAATVAPSLRRKCAISGTYLSPKSVYFASVRHNPTPTNPLGAG